MMHAVIKRFHGWIGITAGLVMALVALTGSLMAFQPQILRTINAETLMVSAEGARLSPVELISAVTAKYPQAQWANVTVAGQDQAPALALVALSADQKPSVHYFHPSTGELLPAVRGEEFFETVEHLHRELLLGDFGSNITGISAILLLGMVIGGSYLRWKRRPPKLSGWFLARRGLKGRAHAFQWHGVLGTWAALLFVFSASTGLSWSYEPYKKAIYSALSVEYKPKPAKTAPALFDAASFQRLMSPAWPAFVRDVGAFDEAVFTPKDADVAVAYWLPDAAHIREKNDIRFNAKGQRIEHKLFAQKPMGEQLTLSWKMLHTGQYWGWSGQLMLLLSSLSLVAMTYFGFRLFFKSSKS
ncbi:MAG: PepSY domain-containing protein [Paraperlucidibaca sp.]|jgi:sulfite reductase (NADPH) flavoprotein alpha-component|nr:PepSY domain-containing protein [Paraperlucidibaca sp.]